VISGKKGEGSNLGWGGEKRVVNPVLISSQIPNIGRKSEEKEGRKKNDQTVISCHQLKKKLYTRTWGGVWGRESDNSTRTTFEQGPS